ncbi:MAG: NAD(P)H-hydrate dehydratase [Frankiales bacterium]|jgi:ADP-dependent NAD(P)H-hydrate dehydratase|nr:NAD(P)H-hydrate dehydratase [Frankiales bacterium]
MSPSPPAEAPAVTPRLLRAWPLPAPGDDATKHERGTVLVVGGAVSTPGAVLLPAIAALRVGAGRLQVATVEATSIALGTAVPEALVVGLPADEDGSLSARGADWIVEHGKDAACVILGPGLLDRDGTLALLEAVLPRLECRSLVLDALALVALAGHEKLLAGRERVVLTPNEGELAALLDGEQLDGRQGASRAAERYGAVVATGGWTVSPDGRVWRDETGGVGLGTSGSGDVLAGAIGGLLALGAESEQAAVFGQYAHAAAGDRLTERTGRLGFLARELLEELPVVLMSLRN